MVLLEDREHVEPASPAAPARGLRVVGDVLELAEHEARHHQRAADEPRRDDVDDAPVDDRARVDVGHGSRRGGLASPSCASRQDARGRAAPCAGRTAWRPSDPSSRTRARTETPMGSTSRRRREVRERQAEQEPHEQAEDEPDDRGHELVGGHVRDGAHDPARRLDRHVRQDRVADDDPAIQHAEQRRRFGARLEEGPRGAGRFASAMARIAPRRHPSSARPLHDGRRYQTARPGALTRVYRSPRPDRRCERFAQRTHRDDLGSPHSDARRRSRPAPARSPAGTRGGRPPAGVAPDPDRSQPAQQRTSPQAIGARRATARSRGDDASARAIARSAAGLRRPRGRRRRWRRRPGRSRRGQPVARAPPPCSASRLPSIPASVRRGMTHPGRRHERLDLDEHGPAALQDGRDRDPGRLRAVVAQERARPDRGPRAGRRRPSPARRSRRWSRSGS